MCIMFVQYAYSLQLTDAELPTKTKAGYKLDEHGLTKFYYPVKTLAIQALLSVVFWVTCWGKNTREKNANRDSVLMQSQYDPSNPIDKTEDEIYMNKHLWFSLLQYSSGAVELCLQILDLHLHGYVIGTSHRRTSLHLSNRVFILLTRLRYQLSGTIRDYCMPSIMIKILSYS
ncbi:hypothetical protein NP493_38g00023 [Ridgeia piscesae]|uniref:Piezo TM1-24 domain-containing protein n=1 Tax=Ridgeia piscesae TaxID=27915 RepID=A0AAD9UK11_RIDPI|nr:hypothetical protein NP493_38g00023 [Ridgeia piscesae]